MNDIYVSVDKMNNRYNEIGVRIVLNGEYAFIVPINIWKGFVYYINTCDFYGWALGCINSIFQQMELDNEIMEIGFDNNEGNNQLYDGYDELEARGVDAKRTPLTRKDRISQLFDG